MSWHHSRRVPPGHCIPDPPWGLTTAAGWPLHSSHLPSLVVGNAPDHGLLVSRRLGLGRRLRPTPGLCVILFGLLRLQLLLLGYPGRHPVPQCLAGAGVPSHLLLSAACRVLGDTAWSDSLSSRPLPSPPTTMLGSGAGTSSWLLAYCTLHPLQAWGPQLCPVAGEAQRHQLCLGGAGSPRGTCALLSGTAAASFCSSW